MNKDLLQRVGLETFAIVFSVLLALFLNSWWAQSKVDAGHYKTLDLIEAEMKANQVELEAAIAYYDDVIKRIQAALPDGITEEEARRLMENCCQLEAGGSHLTAHETAVLTGFYAWLEPSSASAIMSPFVGQKEVNDAAMVLTNVILNVDPEDLTGFFQRYLILSTSLRPSIQDLLAQTNSGLEEVARVKAAH
ncbi:MAG: hypothetical protein EP340_10380 [Alphaproteobacteria bacterium]|nr:MAG: hypothetical protein EP340_10380 [Alphaproteobacteria bacterium]